MQCFSPKKLIGQMVEPYTTLFEQHGLLFSFNIFKNLKPKKL